MGLLSPKTEEVVGEKGQFSIKKMYSRNKNLVQGVGYMASFALTL